MHYLETLRAHARCAGRLCDMLVCVACMRLHLCSAGPEVAVLDWYGPEADPGCWQTGRGGVAGLVRSTHSRGKSWGIPTRIFVGFQTLIFIYGIIIAFEPEESPQAQNHLRDNTGIHGWTIYAIRCPLSRVSYNNLECRSRISYNNLECRSRMFRGEP